MLFLLFVVVEVRVRFCSRFICFVFAFVSSRFCWMVNCSRLSFSSRRGLLRFAFSILYFSGISNTAGFISYGKGFFGCDGGVLFSFYCSEISESYGFFFFCSGI